MMKIHLIACLFVSLSLFSLTACRSMPEIQTEFNPEIDFSGYKTYGLMPLPTDVPGVNRSQIERAGMISQAAITKELNARGYRKVDLEEADFAINLSGKIVPMADTIDMGYTAVATHSWYGYYTPQTYDRGVSIDLYDEGTLMIEIFDGKTKELVWVGWAQARRDGDITEGDKIRDAVEEILSRFPPEK
jgi:hypothetical protein